MRIHFVPLVIAVMLAGCGDGERLQPLEDRVSVLEHRSELQDKLLLDHSTRLTEVQRSGQGPALMSLDGGYGVTSTVVGNLLLAWQEIESSGNGVRITLEVGNPTSATLSGIDLSGSWMGKSSGAFSATEANEIRPGVWNRVRFQIPNVKPDEIEFLSVTVAVEKVKLIEEN